MGSAGLASNQLVRVHVHRQASLEMRVVRAVPGAAELCVTSGIEIPLRVLHRRPAVVVPADCDGERLGGTLLAVGDHRGRLRDDRVHFLQSVVPLRRAAPPQRRDFARVDFARPITMVPEGLAVARIDGFIRNLSAGGLLVAGAGRLELGRRLRLRFALADEELEAGAEIVRADQDWGLRGLRLANLDPATRDALARFVAERQRRAIAQLRARAG
jgi:hypothetical protein